MKRPIQDHAQYATTLCEHFHQNPELSFQEEETAQRMADEMALLGFEVTTQFGGHNVVGVLKNGEGKTILLRADMDALPMEEKTDFEFASKTKVKLDGDEVHVMHACGHDVHSAMLIGAARSLVDKKEEWQGTLILLAQQAEEYGKGATAALDAGLYTKFPVPDYALAMHIKPELPTGTIGLNEGPIFAGVKNVEITVKGIGGHGAYPHKCIDPVIIASRIVLDLQTIISRETNPLDATVLTIGAIQGGTKASIIPDKVKLQLTIRYFSEEKLEQILTAIERICKGAALVAGLSDDKMPDVNISSTVVMPVVNEASLYKKLKAIGQETLGENGVIKTSPEMVGEDFGLLGRTPEQVPICLTWLGCTNPQEMETLQKEGRAPYPLHSPHLAPDYFQTIKTGITITTANALALLAY